MKVRPVTPIAVIVRVTGCRAEAIHNAARIHGIPIIGGLLGKSAKQLPMDFYATAHEEEAMINRSNQRRAS